MRGFAKPSHRSIPIKIAILVSILVLFDGVFRFASAEHIDFGKRNMRAITVGETREDLIFYGCGNRQAAIELSTWIDTAPWTMEKIMADEDGRAKFGGNQNCDEHRLNSAVVSELLYLADQKYGEDKIDRNGEVHFGTRYSSIVKVTTEKGAEYFMLAHQLIDGAPTRQSEICQQVLWPMCP